AQVRRGAAAEIDVVERPAADALGAGVQLDLFEQCVGIDFNVVSVLVGVDAEVAELAPLAAERDVQVQAQRRAGGRRPGEGGAGVGQEGRLPEGERRVVGYEVVAEARFFLSRLRHNCTLTMAFGRPRPASQGDYLVGRLACFLAVNSAMPRMAPITPS